MTRTEHRNMVLQAICESHGVTRKNLLYRCRLRHLVHARWELMTRLHHDVGMTKRAIGRFIGVHHTTVHHGISRYEELQSS